MPQGFLSPDGDNALANQATNVLVVATWALTTRRDCPPTGDNYAMAGKGGRRSTTWGPGQGGGHHKKRIVGEVRDAAKEYTQEALDVLAKWMRSDHPTAGPMAAKELLDRAHGKPAQDHNINHNITAASASDADLAVIALGSGGVVASEADDTPVTH